MHGQQNIKTVMNSWIPGRQ